MRENLGGNFALDRRPSVQNEGGSALNLLSGASLKGGLTNQRKAREWEGPPLAPQQRERLRRAREEVTTAHEARITPRLHQCTRRHQAQKEQRLAERSASR